MANAGYIIIKNKEPEKPKDNKPQGYRAFYGALDKGSALPSFCYPKQKEELRRDVNEIENSLKNGYAPEMKVENMKEELKQKKARLSQLNEQEAEATQLFKENRPAIDKRYAEIKEEIAQRMPAFSDAKRPGRVSPSRVLLDEKVGIKGAAPLGKLKEEYKILSRLMDEDPNTQALQRD